MAGRVYFLLLLLNRNLIDTFLMSPTLEGGSEKLVHNLTRHIVVDKTARHYEYVGIVVLTNQMGYFWNPAKTGAHLLVLVQCDTDAFTRTADGDTRIHFTTFYTLSQRVAEVGVVY